MDDSTHPHRDRSRSSGPLARLSDALRVVHDQPPSALNPPALAAAQVAPRTGRVRNIAEISLIWILSLSVLGAILFLALFIGD